LHNLKNGNDVNNDGYVVAYDALLIINWLNAYGPTEIHRVGAASLPDLFYDTRADNFIAPSDVLMVINYINAHPGHSSLAISDAAEGEAAPSAMSFDSADNTEFLSSDKQAAVNNTPSGPPRFILLVEATLSARDLALLTSATAVPPDTSALDPDAVDQCLEIDEPHSNSDDLRLQ
jgi:hypothetical protein